VPHQELLQDVETSHEFRSGALKNVASARAVQGGQARPRELCAAKDTCDGGPGKKVEADRDQMLS